MRFIKLFVLVLLFSACEKQNANGVIIIGHAGLGLSMQNSIYHDNSFQAVKLALSYPGSNGVEVDVQMDKEGCLWLYHNDVLQDETTGNDCVNSASTSELENVSYKSIHKEKLTKLEEVLTLKDSTQSLFLDIRNMNSCSNSIIDFSAFEFALTNLGIKSLKNTFLIVSNQNWAIELSQSFAVYYCSDNFEDAAFFLAENQQIQGLVIRNKYIIENQVTQIQNLGRSVYLFDIRSPKGNRNALNKNPTGIITDDIRAALIERN
jgi:glycerophosphoryl diester phosphodiesterase